MSNYHTLFVSYTGLTDALGQSQILPYLRGLSQKGISVHVVSCEKPKAFAQQQSRIRSECAAANINWHPLAYHKNPPVLSAWFDFQKMLDKAIDLVNKHDIKLVHCRGYLPGLIGLKLKRLFDVKFVFDMRGFWPDEKLESGAWSGWLYQPIYRYFKLKEKALFGEADYVVSLTEVGAQEIVKQGWASAKKIGTVTTCVDFTTFPPYSEKTRAAVREELEIPFEAPLLVYSGSLGGNYDPSILLEVYNDLCEISPSACLLILAKTDLSYVHKYLIGQGVDTKKIILRQASFPQVYKYLQAADFGLVFYREGYSNLGRCPTKLGEYWASGVKVLLQSDIGDLNQLAALHSDHAGIFRITDGAIRVDHEFWSDNRNTDLLEQRRACALNLFGLEGGVAFYSKVYQRMLN